MSNGLTEAQRDERSGRITGSRVGAILGLSRYATRNDVMRELVREHFGAAREFAGNESTRYGQAHEPDALSEYEAKTGNLVLYTGEDQAFFVHPEHEWLAIHPDGITADGVYCEVKCPHRARYTKPDDNYLAQVQLGMECARHHVKGFKDYAHFVIWREGEPIIVERVDRDPLWLSRNLDALQNFMSDYAEIIADPKLAAPYLADKVRDDAEWRDAVDEYICAARDAKASKAREDAARSRLVGMAPQGAKGCGLQLIRVERAGTIRYADALKSMLPDVDLSPWRGKPSISYTIKESK